MLFLATCADQFFGRHNHGFNRLLAQLLEKNFLLFDYWKIGKISSNQSPRQCGRMSKETN
jgi:hypothetical protein